MAVNVFNAKKIPVEFRVELRDRQFNILELPDNQIDQLNFDFSRIGGCGDFDFSLPRNYCDEKFISGGFNIQIYIWNDTTRIFDLWYQGSVQEKIPQVQSGKEFVRVIGHGYQAQLSNIQIPASTPPYVGMELSAIVKSIIDNFVVPNTNITYDLAEIVSTGFIADSISFATDCGSAITTLGDLAGNYEYGVDCNRKFYFKPRSSTPGIYLSIGQDIINFSEDQDFKDIINQVIIQGGTLGDGSTYTKTFNDAQSQLKFGIIAQIIQNSAITTDDVAAQLATATFLDYNDVIRKATCDLVNRKERFEATIPLPLVVLIADSAILYGQQRYGTFLYSGLIQRQINRISYAIDTNSALSISLDMGNLLPDDADYINRLQYQVEQLRINNL